MLEDSTEPFMDKGMGLISKDEVLADICRLPY